MKSEDFEIDRRLAEAVQAAAGRRSAKAETIAEAILASRPGAGEGGDSPTRLIDALTARLEELVRPVAAPSSSWQVAAAGINPLIGGLLRLFGGGNSHVTLQLPAAARPEASRYEAAFEPSGQGIFLTDRDQFGRMRPAGSLAAAPIVVQVDAIDSRSFLERAPEIAESLRKILLESDGIRAVLDE
ncbi:MAG: hypothetical protein NZR01_05065 [Bryobacteraceae bacterium]|nr:hypothetical protein [Bryobacteraceae bacterium]